MLQLTKADVIEVLALSSGCARKSVSTVLEELTDFAADSEDGRTIDGFDSCTVDHEHGFAEGTAAAIIEQMEFYGPIINGKLVPLELLLEATNKPKPKQNSIPWLLIRKQVFERDGYICRYCGKHIDDPHCDHVIPLCKGGKTTLDNLVTACPHCNMSKDSRTPEEWMRSPCYQNSLARV